jgi:hypothetical protein
MVTDHAHDRRSPLVRDEGLWALPVQLSTEIVGFIYPHREVRIFPQS